MFFIKGKAFRKKLVDQQEDQLEHSLEQNTSLISSEPEHTVESPNQINKESLQRPNLKKIVENCLRNNTSLTNKITSLIPNIIYVYDLEKKSYVYCNSSLSKLLGYSFSKIEPIDQQLFSKILHPEDFTAIAQHHQECLNLKPGDYCTIEYRMQDSQGNWRWFESKDTIFEQDKTGKPILILGVAQDITKIKNTQSKTTQLNRELLQKVQALEAWHDQRLKLTEINQALQVCLTLKEAENVIRDLLPGLFPNSHGTVYLKQNSQKSLKAIATWGRKNSSSILNPDQCWALRKGKEHLARATTPELYCNHIDSNSHREATFCLPMTVKGETMGMLYLSFDTDQLMGDLIPELSATVAQNIAISLANLKLKARLKYQSLRDPLTGLYNRRYLQEFLSREIDRAKRKQHFVGIIMIDIDHFKRFNDVYGHSVGDLVLKKVGSYLRSKIRQYDVACRYGGEEFVIIMPDAAIADTLLRGEEIRQGIKQLKLEYDDQQLESVTVSIGISCFPADGIQGDQLIKAADKALYQAKKEGRNRVRGSLDGSHR